MEVCVSRFGMGEGGEKNRSWKSNECEREADNAQIEGLGKKIWGKEKERIMQIKLVCVGVCEREASNAQIEGLERKLEGGKKTWGRENEWIMQIELSVCVKEKSVMHKLRVGDHANWVIG